MYVYNLLSLEFVKFDFLGKKLIFLWSLEGCKVIDSGPSELSKVLWRDLHNLRFALCSLVGTTLQNYFLGEIWRGIHKKRTCTVFWYSTPQCYLFGRLPGPSFPAVVYLAKSEILSHRVPPLIRPVHVLFSYLVAGLTFESRLSLMILGWWWCSVH